MRLRIGTEYIFGALGLFGSGAQIVWPDQKWIGWGFVGVAALTLALGVRIDGFHVRLGGPTWKARMNPYLFVATIAGLVLVVALVAYFIDRSRGPIVWDFDAGKPPLGVSRSADGPLWIDAFQITGRNRSDDPIVFTNGIVRSDKSNRTLPLMFASKGGLIPLSEASVIPYGEFVLIAIIPSTNPSYSQGIVVDAFRMEFERFTFIYDIGIDKRARHFSEAEVSEFLGKADRETREALSRSMSFGAGAGVVRRQP